MEIILKKRQLRYNGVVSSVGLSTSISPFRTVINLVTIWAGLTNVYTRAETDQAIANAEIWGSAQW